jgi:riboflavin synthase
MFTGIVTDLGRVRELRREGDTRLVIETAWKTGAIDIGASVACSGCCLTVIEKGLGWIAFQASAETLSRTTLGTWAPGTRVNLERALKVGDELGGHIVSGHVDGLATLVATRPEGDSLRMGFELPAPFARQVAEKGSIALDGVSLTVNEVEGSRFGVNVIPHTRQVTTLGALQPGDRVNFEIDMLARYVARLMGRDGTGRDAA